MSPPTLRISLQLVAHEVTQDGHDRHQLHRMAVQAKAAMGVDALDVVADRGYFKGEEVMACDQDNIRTYLPRPLSSSSTRKGLFNKRDLSYHAEDDEYECPAGERLIWPFAREEHGQVLHKYWSSNCPKCSMKARCATAKNRRVARWEHERVVEALDTRLEREPECMRIRRSIAEHPFGTLKCWMGYTHFLTKTVPKVSKEMSLHVLAYNMKRMINILGTRRLIEAIST